MEEEVQNDIVNEAMMRLEEDPPNMDVVHEQVEDQATPDHNNIDLKTKQLLVIRVIIMTRMRMVLSWYPTMNQLLSQRDSRVTLFAVLLNRSFCYSPDLS